MKRKTFGGGGCSQIKLAHFDYASFNQQGWPTTAPKCMLIPLLTKKERHNHYQHSNRADLNHDAITNESQKGSRTHRKTASNDSGNKLIKKKYINKLDLD